MGEVLDFLSGVWAAVEVRVEPTEVLLSDNPLLLWGVALGALFLVATPLIYKFVGLFTTVVHETGHAAAAVLTGSKVRGISIRWDQSGETLSTVSWFWPFRIWVAWWGYPFPGFVGAVFIWAVLNGWQGLALTAVFFLSGALFLQIRSFVALLSIGATLFLSWALWWYGAPALIALVLYAVGWFLLFGGLRDLLSLTLHHSRGETQHSDASALFKLTLIPPPVWLLSFWVANFLCIVLVARALFF